MTGSLFRAGSSIGTFILVATCACGGPADVSAEVQDSVAVTIQADSRAVLEVPLRLHRMDGGTGDVLVTNGVPLPPGWLPNSSAMPPVRVTIAGAEVPIYAEVLKGKHKDGTAMSVLVQFVWPQAAPGDAVLEVDAPSGLPPRGKVDLNGEMPAAAALPIDPEYLVSTLIVGPTVSRFRSPTVPAFFQGYESGFDQWSDAQWQTYGQAWAPMNFYDRVLSHFAFWVRTGNPVLWERAARIAVDYRKGYLEAASFGASEMWGHLDGLALHYWLAGDSSSRDAVFKTAESLHRSRGGEVNMAGYYTDNRSQSVVLMGKVLSYRLEAPPYGAVTDWRSQAASDVSWILSSQKPEGYWGFSVQCGHSSNFMTGMLSSSLIAYYEHLQQDPAILLGVRRFQDWLWDTQWRQADQVFNYYSGDCPGVGGAEPAWDLNGFYLEAFGWLNAVTNDPKYLDRGDATFSGMVTHTWLAQTKQFNQAYRLTWRYLAYRR